MPGLSLSPGVTVLKIDWEGLIVGFESRSHQITHFFDRETGDVVQVLERDAGAARGDEPRTRVTPRCRATRASARRGDLEDFLARCEDAGVPAGPRSRARDSPTSRPRYREALLRHPKEEARFFQFKERPGSGTRAAVARVPGRPLHEAPAGRRIG